MSLRGIKNQRWKHSWSYKWKYSNVVCYLRQKENLDRWTVFCLQTMNLLAWIWFVNVVWVYWIQLRNRLHGVQYHRVRWVDSELVISVARALMTKMARSMWFWVDFSNVLQEMIHSQAQHRRRKTSSNQSQSLSHTRFCFQHFFPLRMKSAEVFHFIKKQKEKHTFLKTKRKQRETKINIKI